MTIHLKRFGQILSSRPEGREAALVLLATELRQHKETLELDFSEVLVMTPSWLGEFVNTLSESGIAKISYSNQGNASVKASIEMTQTMQKLESSGS